MIETIEPETILVGKKKKNLPDKQYLAYYRLCVGGGGEGKLIAK